MGEELKEEQNKKSEIKEKVVEITDNQENEEIKEEKTKPKEESQKIEEPQKSEEEQKTEEIEQKNEPQKEKQKAKKVKKTKSKDEIKQKIATLQESVEGAYKDYSQTLELFKQKSSKLAEQENAILNSTVSKILEKFKQLKIENLQNIKNTINEIELENQEELLKIQEPPTGKFKGFMFGLFVALITMTALFAYGAYLAKLPLKPPTLLQKSNLDLISQKFVELTHLQIPNWGGYILVAIIAIIVWFLVYKLTVALTTIKNQKYISKKEQESQEYKLNLQRKKQNLINLIEHIDRVISVNKKYDIILQEQNAKLNRIMFIEEPKELNDLHPKSKSEVDKTILLVDELVKLMDTPVSINDKLNPHSIDALKSANVIINEVIKGLY